MMALVHDAKRVTGDVDSHIRGAATRWRARSPRSRTKRA